MYNVLLLIYGEPLPMIYDLSFPIMFKLLAYFLKVNLIGSLDNESSPLLFGFKLVLNICINFIFKFLVCKNFDFE